MIALIGSGNVAHWIAQRLRDSNEFPIAQVYSRHLANARSLAEEVGAQAIDDLSQLNPNCEIYIFSLKDDAYAEVLSKLPFRVPVALHTAGTVSQNIFENSAVEYGVVYPLQTFSKSVPLHDLEVPLCLEYNHTDNSVKRVKQLAAELSDMCYDVPESDRAVLHLAAVFACNFSNAMAHAAADILQSHGLDLKMLLPVMRQTLEKLSVMSPAEAQTGPAARHDANVMEKHIQSLPDENLKQLYCLISKYIMQYSK